MGTLLLAAPNRDCGEATKIGCGLVGKGKLTVWLKFLKWTVNGCERFGEREHSWVMHSQH